MREKTDAFKAHVREISANPNFVHHKWFVKWHLEIVERLALELASKHPEADRNLVEVMAWLHDYGKILDFDHAHDRQLLDIGRDKLADLGFEKVFADKAADYIELLDKKLEIDLHEAPIEVQIVSSADGCSHMIGPFIYIFWNEPRMRPLPARTLRSLWSSTSENSTKIGSTRSCCPKRARPSRRITGFSWNNQANSPPSSFKQKRRQKL